MAAFGVSGVVAWSLGFRGLGFRGLGFRGLGFRVYRAGCHKPSIVLHDVSPKISLRERFRRFILPECTIRLRVPEDL